ncbi:MAG: hypothetical protein ACFFD1_09730 [Candidatus Thorarchaeota archaeon]
MRNVGSPLYFHIFGENLANDDSDEQFISGFLSTVNVFSQKFGINNILHNIGLNKSKIFFEYLPGHETYVCVGILNKFITDKYLLNINAFMSDLKKDFSNFLLSKFIDNDFFNSLQDYDYYITSVIIDPVYHKHFSSVKCLLYPNTISFDICTNSSPNF